MHQQLTGRLTILGLIFSADHAILSSTANGLHNARNQVKILQSLWNLKNTSHKYKI
jgi:hypothetical protein